MKKVIINLNGPLIGKLEISTTRPNTIAKSEIEEQIVSRIKDAIIFAAIDPDDTPNNVHTSSDVPEAGQTAVQTNLSTERPATVFCTRPKDEHIIEHISGLAQTVQSMVNRIPRPYRSTQLKAGLKVDLQELVSACQDLTGLLLHYPELLRPQDIRADNN